MPKKLSSIVAVFILLSTAPPSFADDHGFLKKALDTIQVLESQARTAAEERKFTRTCQSLPRFVHKERFRIDSSSIELIVSALESSENAYARTWLALATASAGIRAKPWLPRLRTTARKLEAQYEKLPWDQQPQGNSDLSFVNRAIKTIENRG